MRIQSPESDEDNENPRPPAKKATKASTTRKKSSNDGIEADNIVEGRRNGRSSMKQAENGTSSVLVPTPCSPHRNGRA